MNAGQLDRRVTIQEYSTTRDSWNNPTKTWTALATVWAMRRDQSSREVLESNAVTNLNRTLFKIRYRDDVDTTMRILHDGDYFYITGVRQLGRKEALEITTEQRD